MADTIEGLTGQALADLTKGRRSLERYFKENKQDDLLVAQKHFRSLVSRSPEYPDGYLMLSYALAENRQEQEAIGVYDQALQLLGNPDKSELQKRRKVYEAKFFKASSLLRMYRWEDVVEAARQFQSLATDLDNQTNGQPPTQPEALELHRKNRYLLARAQAETAHCYGHALVLLPKDRSIRPYYEVGLRFLLDDATIDALPTPDAIGNRRSLADALLAKSEQFQALSSGVTPIHEKEWKGDRAARLAEVHGYALYRHAEWLAIANDADFKRDCHIAIRDLETALLRRPRSYALLQNLGMIHLNRRFDTKGSDLDIAERYYTRSIEQKPGDYYGPQQLARIYLRKAILANESTARDAALARGVTQIKASLDLAPNSRTGIMLSFYLRLAKIGSAKQPPVDDLTAFVDDANRFDPNASDRVLLWMRLGIGAYHLVGATTQANFTAKKTDLLEKADQFVGAIQDDGIWRNTQMRNATQQLRDRVNILTFDERQSLQFDLIAALD